MLWKLVFVLILGILIGYSAHSLTSNPEYIYIEKNTTKAIPENRVPVKPYSFREDGLAKLLNFERATERISPFDWIKENEIHVYNDKVVIDLENPEWASFTDTNSMDPVLDETANAIEIVPKSPEDIHIGDIVSYSTGKDTVIHRVIGKGKDSKGVFFIIKGDNNPNRDPEKVRFEHIKRVVVAIIY